MTTLLYDSAFRKLMIRIKRWYLGRQYRHMAKTSRYLDITSTSNPTIIWKKQQLCSLVPLGQLHNSQLGNKAFIIASGPSLKHLDIRKLRNSKTFGVNGSIVKFVETGISPSYYVISDEDFVYNRPHLLDLILKDKTCHCFFTPQAVSAICDINPQLLADHSKISLFHNHFKDYGKPALEYVDIAEMALNDPEIITKDGRIGFSLNPEKGVFTAHTVSYFALQIAYGLGFREINLVGMDLGSPNGETRFYEQGEKAMPSHLDRDYVGAILPSFEIVGELCRQNKFKVFNLSHISRLPDSVIPKKDFSEVIEDL